MQSQGYERSLITILKQDESVLRGETMIICPTTEVGDGPSDQYFRIEPQNVQIKKDKKNNFLIHPSSTQFGAANAYGVCSLVLAMYSRDVNKLSQEKNQSERLKSALKYWKQKPQIPIYPNYTPDEDVANAEYDPNNKELHFFSFTRPDDPTERLYTSHSFDIVAHEAGHALLDQLRPDYIRNARTLETGALHEAFGDLTAMFTILDTPVLRYELLSATKGDLDKKSFLPTLAEDFGLEIGYGRKGLRLALNKIDMDNVEPEVHAVSQVFTGVMYDFISQWFKKLRADRGDVDSDDEILAYVGSRVRYGTLKAFIEAHTSEPTFATIGKLLQKIAMDEKLGFEDYIRDAFAGRKIYLDEEGPRKVIGGKPVSEASVCPCICGTMKKVSSS